MMWKGYRNEKKSEEERKKYWRYLFMCPQDLKPEVIASSFPSLEMPNGATKHKT